MIIIYDCVLNIPADTVIVAEPGGEKGKVNFHSIPPSSFF